MALTRKKRLVKKRKKRKGLPRMSAREAIGRGIKALDYSSFEDYLFDRQGWTLRKMAQELGVPESTFVAEHRKFIQDAGIY